MNEKMKVLELLEAGKINAEEATRLLEAMGTHRTFISKESRAHAEERFHKFAQDVNKFAAEVGGKMKEVYREVEPKLKKASQTALEKAAAALDNLACKINESLEKSQCCEDPECGCNKEVEPCCEEGSECCCDEPKQN